MQRRVSDISEDILYPKSTTYLRIVEMILCAVCFGLACYVWAKGNVLLGAVVILFATSFGFLAVTFIDFLASWKRRQYAAPFWAGLAFLATFMFFLSFGFMILQSFIGYVLIGVAFGITAIVFLLDGIIIILHFFQSRVPKKVHPISRETNSLDKATQTDDDLMHIEGAIKVEKIEPVFVAPRDEGVNTSPSGSIPTIHSVSELGSPRRNTLENSPETQVVPNEAEPPRHPSTDNNRNIYPPISVPNAPEDQASSVPSEPETLQQIPLNNRGVYESVPPTCYPPNQQSPQTYNPPNQGLQPPEDFVAPPNWTQPPTQGPMMPPHQAMGEPQPPYTVIDPRYPFQIPPGTASCRCCATRPSQEARDQIAPFVMHHYNQTPCPCGYTHYQSSTVVRGAVKQYPRDTVQQQQEMIKDQLDQMRDSTAYPGCSCHDGPAKGNKVSYIRPVRDSSTNAGNGPSLNSTEVMAGKLTEHNSNTSLHLTGSILEGLSQSNPRTRRASNDSRRRVTLGSSELIPSSNSPEQKQSKNEKNKRESEKSNRTNRPPIEYDNVYAEDGQTENWQPRRPDDLGSGQSFEDNLNARRRLGQVMSRTIPLSIDRDQSGSSSSSGSNDSNVKITSTTGLLGENDYESSSIVCRGLPPKCHCCPNVKDKTRRSQKYSTGTDKGASIDSKRNEKDENVLNRTFVVSKPPLDSSEASGSLRASRDIPNEERINPQTLELDGVRNRPGFLDNNAATDNALPATLARTLDPIEELRSREGTQKSDSEERIDRFPPYYNCLLKEVSRQTSCSCTCICDHQKKTKEIPNKTKNSTASNTNKYENVPLNQKPYHPKDEFKMPENPFNTVSQGKNIPEDCFCEVYPRRRKGKKNSSTIVDDEDDRPMRTPPEPALPKKRPSKKRSLKCLEECPDCLARKRKQEVECPEECSSCPIRIARLAMEARSMDELDGDWSSTPTRGSLKSSSPDGRK